MERVLQPAQLQRGSLFGLRRLPRLARFRRQVPEVLQLEVTECGAACLAMVLRYHGCQTTVSDIRERCGIGRDGLNALALVRTAQHYGLRARGLSLKQADLRVVTLPAIVHWQFNHFLVVERWSTTAVDVIDPALGRMRLSAEEFEGGFTGVVITLEPGVHFQKEKAPSQPGLRHYVGLLLGSPALVAQVLLASLVLQTLGLGVPLLTKGLIDQVLPGRVTNVLVLLGLGVVVLVASQLIAGLLRSTVLVYLQARVDTQTMLGFFEQLLSLPYRFFQQRASGELLARVNSNIAIREVLTGQLLSGLLDSALVLVYLGILFWQSRTFALLAVIAGLLQVGVMLLSNRKLRELTQRDLAAQGKAQAFMTEALVGIATLKAAGREASAFEQWSNFYCEQLNVSVRRSYLTGVVENSLAVVRTFSPLVLLWFGTLEVLGGAMSLGTMLALNALAAAFLAPLTSLVASGQRLQLVQAHFERVGDVLEAEPEQDARAVHTPPRLTGSVELKNVSFRYDATAAPVLRNVSLRIAPGQKVALVGPSGSGKSTLLKLLVGLYQPTDGEIAYDGRALSHFNLRALRQQLGVVMQDAFVFSGTIRSNIAFNQPDLPLERVIKAAELAALHEEIARMPMGYETFVSEGGSALSGGQRQRLALARALAHSPSIVLLDEATSHLDTSSEQAVEQNLSRQDCTRIVIAHRLSTVRDADLIVVLDQGAIVEQGSHQELLARHGFYARLAHGQLETLTSTPDSTDERRLMADRSLADR
jgi:HlyB family type I secretion system ABC transporter